MFHHTQCSIIHKTEKSRDNVDRINSISHWQCLCVCERYKNWSLPDSHLDISNSQCESVQDMYQYLIISVINRNHSIISTSHVLFIYIIHIQGVQRRSTNKICRQQQYKWLQEWLDWHLGTLIHHLSSESLLSNTYIFYFS